MNEGMGHENKLVYNTYMEWFLKKHIAQRFYLFFFFMYAYMFHAS